MHYLCIRAYTYVTHRSDKLSCDLISYFQKVKSLFKNVHVCLSTTTTKTVNYINAEKTLY